MSEQGTKHVTSFGEGMPADSPAAALRMLPARNWAEEVTGITSIVIVPAIKRGGVHESGYRVMDFAACHYGTAYVLLSGCSDVIHLGGIAGFNNQNWVNDRKTKRGQWSIDCLPNSGLLQLFSGGELIVGSALSSFEVWSTEERPSKAGEQQ